MPGFDFLNGIAAIFFRVLPVFLFVPVFSAATIANRFVRSSIIFIFCMPFLDVLVIPDTIHQNFIEVLFYETVIGLFIAIPIALPFYIANAIGEIIDNQRGATLSNTIDPSVGVESSPMAIFFAFITNVLFLISPGVLLLIQSINDSYRLFPYAVKYNLLSMDLSKIYSVMDMSLLTGTFFILPVLIIMFLSEVFLGILSRFSPQMNSFSLSLTVKSFIGISMLFLYFQKVYPKFITEQFQYVW